MSVSPPPNGWPNDIQPPVHFANAQWAVTDYGLECTEPGNRYQADGRRMNERRPGADLYDWPCHMAEKEWVRLSDFMPAFEFALRHFKPADYDQERMRRSQHEAHLIASQR